eukprot:364339-Chlamydomonas_euryale.AAC.8
MPCTANTVVPQGATAMSKPADEKAAAGLQAAASAADAGAPLSMIRHLAVPLRTRAAARVEVAKHS